MIRIFNKKEDIEIRIDESVDWITFMPKHYEDKPYLVIEFENFSFSHHALECKDCNIFLNSFGKDSTDWYISFSNNTYRLNTKNLGQKGHSENEIISTSSKYHNGSRLTLTFHEIPTELNELQKLLSSSLEFENYEKACILRDLINEQK